MTTDPFKARNSLETQAGGVGYFRLDVLGEQVHKLPHTLKILLENLLRRAGTPAVTEQDVTALAAWPEPAAGANVAFMPSRVLMQDFTGVPAVVDLASLRSAIADAGGDPKKVNPFVPVDLIIDHSVNVDRFGSMDAYRLNIEWEYRRNRERYTLLRWAQQAFDDFRVVPPGMGICHQVNLEYLGRIVRLQDGTAIPDTLVGTDSHTPMVNGLGCLGWGVGGIEAEAAMLGQPMFLPTPIVIGVRTTGALPTGTTATDLVLTLTQMLRAHGVVGKFVEFFGAGLSTMTVADRATLSNMCPEYGATAALFPCDQQSLKYLRETGRGDDVLDLVERYTKEQGLFRSDEDPDPVFSEVLDLDLSSIEPSLAGPRRPQDRVPLARAWDSFKEAFEERLSDPIRNNEVGRFVGEGGNSVPPGENATTLAEPSEPGHVAVAGQVHDGSVVIAAITSCTNTSNPTVMVAAGLLAKKAIEAGLQTKPWVKTSLAPGSRVVTEYLEQAGLTPYLEKLGFNLVGYGCTTCIGNSGPLPDEIAKRVSDEDLTVVSVLSGNRNFEGRIHPQVRASYLASPPLCVAYALAGHISLDLTKDPLGEVDGKPIYLSDIWPSADKVAQVVAKAMSVDQYHREYGRIFEGDENWKGLPAPTGLLYDWNPESTYVQNPPFFEGITAEVPPARDIIDARVLVLLGDSITTDHISPAGSIKVDSPAGTYLRERGVEVQDFNSFGSRRGNHDVMLRGTFGNIRLRNQLAPGTEGPWTVHFPDGDQMSIYDASLQYGRERTPLLVIGGKEYGSGSSRDWAAKGTALLGVRAVIAESFERIHRSNLVGMGVLPLQFSDGQNAEVIGLRGDESFTIKGISAGLSPRQELEVAAVRPDRTELSFPVTVRIDAQVEVDYYLHGGILQMVLRQLL